MDAGIREFVRNRALGLCEYCRMPDEFDPLPFCIDHIISQQHHGPTAESNLALSCFNGNSYKGPNIAGIDPETGLLTRLFHPRVDEWSDHFEWDGPRLLGTMGELEEELQTAVLETIPVEKRLRGLPAEERLRGLPPEERLRGLSPEEVLRRFTPEQVAGGLSDEQAARLRELLDRRQGR